jgi:hypothetical protein
MGRILNINKLLEIAEESYEQFKNSNSKFDALKIISNTATKELGHYLNIYAFNELNDVIIGFVELLDQIIFEIEEEISKTENGIEEYLIDDLYQRVNSYLELFKNIEIYKKNLRERLLNLEDPLIIRYYNLEEFVPSLIREFFEQPDMRLIILKSLLFFKDDELLNFFYEIAKNDYDMELRIFALIGLKQFKYRFNNWHILKGISDNVNELIDYVQCFSPENIDHSNHNNNPYIILFKAITIELSLIKRVPLPDYSILLNFFYDISKVKIENLHLHQHTYKTISNILKRIDFNLLKSSLLSKESLMSFLNLIDVFPVELFDSVMIIIDLLGKDFLSTVERLIVSRELKLDEEKSNLLGYVLAQGLDSVML